MAKLEIAVLIGAESKEFLAELTRTVEKLEALASEISVKTAEVSPEVESPKKTVAAPAPKTVKKVAAPKVEVADESEEFDLDSVETDDAPEVKAVTKSDLISACRENREAAIKVLKKLKVKSVHELKPAQYSSVLAEIGA